MSAELFIGPIDLSPYVIFHSNSGETMRIQHILLKDVPLVLQTDVYLLLTAFNAEQGIEWEQRLRLFLDRRCFFAITRWEYQDYGSLSDLKLYQGFDCRVKLTLDRGKWYRTKEQSWEISPIFSSGR